MQILGPNSTASAAFIVAPGKQVTLSAQGLSADDLVIIEIVTLSSAPEFKGNPCCDLQKANIEVTSAVPLKCPDNSVVQMTADHPFVVLDGPQLVTMRARVEADAGAAITVDLNESDSDGCVLCACRCVDSEWTPTGGERCVGTDVEREERSNCGTLQWVVDRPQTWTPTGLERCAGTNVEREEKNDCGTSRWVVDRAQTWVDTGEIRCTSTDVEKEQVNDCGATKWVVKGPLTWTPTGQERCKGTDVEREEKNDCCCETRWVIDRAQTWVDTGEIRCTSTDVEKEQVNDCGATKWVVKGPLTWTPTGQERCKGSDVEREEKNDCCCETRWVIDRAQTWTDTGETRCENNVVKKQQRNDCGTVRWFATTTVCGYCPSLRLSCDGQPGFGFHEMDPKDPAATVEMAPCAGDTFVDSIWIYPSAGPGHTVKVTECDGTLIGYAANKSDCAPDCGCPKDPVINITNKFAPTTNVAAPEVTNTFSPTTNVAAPEVTNTFLPTTNVAAPGVTVTLPAPNVVAASFDQDGELTITRSDATTVTAQIPTC